MNRRDGAEIRVVIPLGDHAAIKAAAKRSHRTLTAEVLRALQAYLARPDLAQQALDQIWEARQIH